MENFLQVQHLMLERRKIIAKYAQFFNVSSHHPLEKVPTESAASAPMNFLQTASGAIALMTFLIVIFVSKVTAVVSVITSILSICIGTVAYLHLWSVRLDAISLISMLMSIGFSVDYSAHICYHFFTYKDEKKVPKIIKENSQGSSKLSEPKYRDSTLNEDSAVVKLEHTLSRVGRPVLQSGISTILGMIPLIFVNAYVVEVFWKTVIIVTTLGMIHALIILPCIILIPNDLKNIILGEAR